MMFCHCILVPVNATIQANISRSGTARAGERYTLICTVSKTIGGLLNFLNVSWTTGEQTVTNDNSMTVSTTVGNTSSVSILTFNPLRTSHGRNYDCRGSLESPALTRPLATSGQERVNIQSSYNNYGAHTTSYQIVFLLVHLVPPPTISVHDPPTPYNGTIFTLTGVVQLDKSVDTEITASGVWSSGDGPQETTSPPYPTNLIFRPLTSDSSGDYILTVTVKPSDNSPFIVGNNSSTTYSLVVQCKLIVYGSNCTIRTINN